MRVVQLVDGEVPRGPEHTCYQIGVDDEHCGKPGEWIYTLYGQPELYFYICRDHYQMITYTTELPGTWKKA